MLVGIVVTRLCALVKVHRTALQFKRILQYVKKIKPTMEVTSQKFSAQNAVL